ncbi:DUF3387 domain-containing protein [Escherichia sp. E4742]|uniref:DUF3387 domain-containing protein n=1 Tax=Escherichia sp. E4742 TaxID=2044467 RepID=UPI001436AC11|nr:DUF3387 domain-containing protein [Escherichia sp. E4742]
MLLNSSALAAGINKIKLPATKIQLLQKLLEKAISDFKKVNQLQGINFTRRRRERTDAVTAPGV